MKLKFDKPPCFGNEDYNYDTICVVCDFFQECCKEVSARRNRDIYDDLFGIFP